MKKNLTPLQAYKRVVEMAQKEGVSLSKYAEDRGVPRYILSYWKLGRVNSIRLDLAENLGIL